MMFFRWMLLIAPALRNWRAILTQQAVPIQVCLQVSESPQLRDGQGDNCLCKPRHATSRSACRESVTSVVVGDPGFFFGRATQ